MKSWTAALAAMVLSAMPLRAETPQETPVTTFELDNGMQVVVVEDHRAPVVVHMVWYKAGSADETAGTSGIAHFLEHLMFKGTDKLEAGEFSKVVAENGGTDNAFTSFDQTAYHQRVAADRLGLMMQMEADRMVNLHLTEQEIATERDVILEERSMRVDNDPGSLLREQMNASLYLNHRYGVPVIGWRREMEQLDRDDALAFYTRFYAPNNAVLVVAGDTTPEEVRTLAEGTYGQIAPNPELADERVRPQEPPQLAARHIELQDPRVAQPYVMRSYLAPERDPGAQTQAAALTLLAEVLGGGQTSVLNQSLQFEQHKVIYVGASYNGTSYDDGSLGFGLVPAPGVSLAEAEAALDEELARFIDDGVDPAQLERIKFQMRASQIYERDNVASVAQRYGNALTSGLTIEDVQAWPDLLQAVTGDDIIAAARDVLDKRHSVTGYLTAPDDAPQTEQAAATPPPTPQTEVTQ